jgi:hypothetical protein
MGRMFVTQQLNNLFFPNSIASQCQRLEIAKPFEHPLRTEVVFFLKGPYQRLAEVDFSPSDLAKGRPGGIVARCTNIASRAPDNLAALADYKITQAKLTALTKKTSAYEGLVSKPRLGVAKKAAANQAVPRLLKQGRNILTRRVDKLMVQFRESAPEFFAEYKTARKIVDQRATQSSRSNILPAVTKPEDVLKAA